MKILVLGNVRPEGLELLEEFADVKVLPEPVAQEDILACISDVDRVLHKFGDIADIRSILQQHRDTATIFLGGVPMIVADSIDFIARDLRTFGAALGIFLVAFLALILRRIQWVALPMVVCISVGVCVIGFLWLVNWPVTIVSSNFIALLLIFTLSFCLHQIVRYRECANELPGSDQRALVGEMVRTIGVPCFYMVFTTIVAFGSLVVSGIRPIIDFGWIMATGLMISFVLSFTLFPAPLSY